MSIKYLRFATTKWFLFAVGLVLGAAVILGIRFYTYKPDTVHYHANFALYINGQQEQFKGPQYYEESAMCAVSNASTMTPTERAHMHDNINDVVHIEDHAVTWGDFFANLGWSIGSNFIAQPDGTMYLENGNTKLNVILNAQDLTDISSVADSVIRDQDRLLVNYGEVSEPTLMQEYRAIPGTAHHYDVAQDPKSCSGHDSSTMFQDRLKHLF